MTLHKNIVQNHGWTFYKTSSGVKEYKLNENLHHVMKNQKSIAILLSTNNFIGRDSLQ